MDRGSLLHRCMPFGANGAIGESISSASYPATIEKPIDDARESGAKIVVIVTAAAKAAATNKPSTV